MAKAAKNEYFVAYTIGILLASLITGFLIAWFFLKPAKAPAEEIAYTKFGPIVVSNQNYAIRASVSIQTSSDNEDWAKQHRGSLEGIIQRFLAQEDTQQTVQAKGLSALQDELKKSVNTALNTAKVQNAWLTDFILVEN